MARGVALLVGNWIGAAIVAYALGRLIEATSAPGATRDLIVLLMWPLVVVGGTVLVAAYLLRRPGSSLPPERSRDGDGYRRALHTALIWLYRRDDGYGTTYNGAIREVRPWREYARSRYDALDLEGEPIEPWQISATPEPGQDDQEPMLHAPGSEPG